MEITNEVIRTDIKIVEKRIYGEEEKLTGLPEGYSSFKEHKKRIQAKRGLGDEIRHVKTLIGYAEEALSSEMIAHYSTYKPRFIYNRHSRIYRG